MDAKETMLTFDDALDYLGIADYKERIWRSNSHGELFHLADYCLIALSMQEHRMDGATFRPWFVKVVEWAEQNWKRPESVFQHILAMFREDIEREQQRRASQQ